jgi:hypothetical protein
MMTTMDGWSVHGRNKSFIQKSDLGNNQGIQNIYARGGGGNAPVCQIMHLETVKNVYKASLLSLVTVLLFCLE